MMDGYGFMNGWGGPFFGGAMMIFWFVLIVGLIVLAVRWLGIGSGRDNSPDAMEILRQRYARGEIDAAEFEERKERLQ